MYCFSSDSSNECEMNNKPPAMPVRLNGFSEKIPPMLGQMWSLTAYQNKEVIQKWIRIVYHIHRGIVSIT